MTRDRKSPGTANMGVPCAPGSALSSVIVRVTVMLSLGWPEAANSIGPDSEIALAHSSSGFTNAPPSITCFTGVATSDIVTSEVPTFFTMKSNIEETSEVGSRTLDDAESISSESGTEPFCSRGMISRPCLDTCISNWAILLFTPVISSFDSATSASTSILNSRRCVPTDWNACCTAHVSVPPGERRGRTFVAMLSCSVISNISTL